MVAKVPGHEEKTKAFICTDVHTTLLRLNNKYGGINVDVQMDEGGVYISLSAYAHGNAPALIVNHTPYDIKVWEKNSLIVRTIQQYNRMFYTWDTPDGPRLLVWEDGPKKDIEDNLRKVSEDLNFFNFDDLIVNYILQDTLGIFKHPDVPDTKLYYVSFLDGIQRVLLFTQSQKIAEDCQLVGSLEVIDQDITMKIHGLGLSLVNNINRTELLYMCIASSGIIWEGKKSPSGRWKALSDREVFLIEEGYQKYMMELQVDKESAYRVALEPKFEVLFLWKKKILFNTICN